MQSLDLQADDRLEAALAYRFKDRVDVDVGMFGPTPDRLPDPKLGRLPVLESQQSSSGGGNKHVEFSTHPKAVAHAAWTIDLGDNDLAPLVINGQMARLLK